MKNTLIPILHCAADDLILAAILAVVVLAFCAGFFLFVAALAELLPGGRFVAWNGP